MEVKDGASLVNMADRADAGNPCMHAQWLQLCPSLCDPMDYSPLGSSVHGIDSPGKDTGVGCHALSRTSS